MTSTIRAIRLSLGMSVNELASRLGVTASAVSQLERSEVDETIKLSTLREAHAAMRSELRLTAGPRSANSLFAPYRVADAMTRALTKDKDPVYSLRLLTQAVAEAAASGAAWGDDLTIPPTPLPDKRWDTLMRAMFARAVPSELRPTWMKVEPLPEPWFVSQYPLLRERAVRNTSADLRALNIFIDERSLTRA